MQLSPKDFAELLELEISGGGKPAHFHLCLSKGYTTNQAPGKHTPRNSVKYRRKEPGTSLLNHIKLY